ncbi:MAG: preprotein translocase subunit SecE [Phycisphaerales bacterium]|nr:preprotein translocase subunit SecE [Phycisphaerales bacterium]
MAAGIYKVGQGYWVRVMTATMIGVITLAAAAWMWSQMARLHERLPKVTWTVVVDSVPTSAAVGQTVTLLAKETGGKIGASIGTGVITQSTGKSIGLKDMNMTDRLTDATSAGAVEFAGGAAGAAPVRTLVTSTPRGLPVIEVGLLQGLVAGLVILIGAVIGYYATAVHQRFVDFLISTDGEMKKVNWSTVRDIRMSTTVVIFAAFMLAGSLFVVDFAFQWFFRAIGVLV